MAFSLTQETSSKMSEEKLAEVEFQRIKFLEIFIEDHKTRCWDSPLRLGVVQAAEKIVAHLKQHPAARIGTVLNQSPKNLIWVVKETFTPIFKKFSVEKDIDIMKVLSALERQSKADALYKASGQLRDIAYQYKLEGGSEDDHFLHLIRDVFEIIGTDFRPANKSKKHFTYYCPYCYRYAQPGGTACHVCEGSKRQRQTKLEERLLWIHREMLKRGYFEDKNLEMRLYLPIAYAKLKSIPLPNWKTLQQCEHKAWVISVLKEFELCSRSRIELVADELLDYHYQNAISTKQYYLDSEFYAKWPIFFHFDFIRYEVYQLAELTTPSRQISERIQLAWSGKEPREIASALGVSNSIICRQIAKWEKEINALRLKGVKDEVIKLIFNLEVLPPHPNT